MQHPCKHTDAETGRGSALTGTPEMRELALARPRLRRGGAYCGLMYSARSAQNSVLPFSSAEICLIQLHMASAGQGFTHCGFPSCTRWHP